MNFGLLIESVLNEEAIPELDLQRYKLYIDLNDQYIKCVMRNQRFDNDKTAKENLETVKYVLATCHKDMYQDLSQKEVDKVKFLFKSDYIEKKNTEYALGGLKQFVKHFHSNDK